jgi:hypothetical protein
LQKQDCPKFIDADKNFVIPWANKEIGSNKKKVFEKQLFFLTDFQGFIKTIKIF